MAMALAVIRSLHCFIICVIILVILLTNTTPCLCKIRCYPEEAQALLLLKTGFNVSGDSILPSWVMGSDCCRMWDGISCDPHTNRVIALDIEFDPWEGSASLIFDSLCHLRFLKNVTLVGVTGTLPPCLPNLHYLQYLLLNYNNFGGIIPPTFCLLTNLTFLDLGWNEFSGSIPSCFGNLSSLEHLYLQFNKFSGSIPPSLGNLSSLRTLYLHRNKLSGSIPSSFARLSSLRYFAAHENAFNETLLPSSLPSSITLLGLSLNRRQSISETFFYKFKKLVILFLTDCFLDISTTWIPSFQLKNLCLVSCGIDGEFPAWISTQFSLENLILVNNGLVGEIPSWLWNTSPVLKTVNLSTNNLQGSLLSNNPIWMQLTILDLSNNSFSGHIPSMWSPTIKGLQLNDNCFSGNIFPGFGSLSQLEILNLANNNLTGTIPESLANCSSLKVLNLGNNRLTGKLPNELGKLSELYSLVVRNNKLKGFFPPSISNCSNLQLLDIGHNSFQGHIPKLVGNLSKLRVLVMENNFFKGSIPAEIGQLTNLQILLLSSNRISGFIPHTILSLQGMAMARQDGSVLSAWNYLNVLTSSNYPYYQEGLHMTSKGRYEHYPYILATLTALDLSNNELRGNLPPNFGDLKGLMLLNLSMNNLNGNIPNSLGEMRQLESLDLSSNKFSGKIPGELESLSYLGSFNLSNNNLSGSIPQGRHISSTFGESSYSGNPSLWGCPLPRNCSLPQFAPPPLSIDKQVNGSEIPWYEIAVGLSYGAGFGVTLSLITIRMSWRIKYFKEVDTILKSIFPWMKNLTL